MTKRLIEIVSETALLIAAAVVVALRERAPATIAAAGCAGFSMPRRSTHQSGGAQAGAAVAAPAAPDASRAVAIVCGADEATADRYEARNDALRSIARRRDLPKTDVAALMAYLRSHDDSMRVERVAC